MRMSDGALSRGAGIAGTVLSGVALLSCWAAAAMLVRFGRAALAAGGMPPAALQAAVEAAMSPDLPGRLLHWAEGACALGAAAALALSAAEGTWWLSRRLSRPR